VSIKRAGVCVDGSAEFVSPPSPPSWLSPPSVPSLRNFTVQCSMFNGASEGYWLGVGG
jgi:hypothetical protein